MRLPLLFSFQQLVVGAGFLAGVRVNGHALLDEAADDGTWITGAAPVGFAGGGADRGTAFAEFRNAWIAVLFDIASESGSFEAFRTATVEFLSSKAAPLTAEWEAALAEVRRTDYRDPHLKREVVDGHKVVFEVVDLTHLGLQPKLNELDHGWKAAA